MISLFFHRRKQCRRICFCICAGLFILPPLSAQHKLTIIVSGSPKSHTGEPVFIAGNFNGWNPGNKDYQLKEKDNKLSIELNGIDNHSEFKFTRGEWSKVESDSDGKDIANRVIDITNDTTVNFVIDGWADDFTKTPKQHTASNHVSIVDTAFTIPQLSRTRRIWIYLPPGYDKSKQTYPVMYMQDGQNVFDNYTAAFGEWGVDETADSLIEEERPACIIVAIDNGGETRMNEYNPYAFTWKDSSNSKTFTPEGDAYLDFIANTLKPFIDEHYRTKKSKENTCIAGSSMGGLISYYALLKYPQTFGSAGIFSPAFWTADGIKKLTDSAASNLNAKLFFYMGGEEGEKNIQLMDDIVQLLGKKSPSIIYSVVDPAGSHNEAAWRKWFPEFYKWVMASGFNVD